MPKYYYKAGKTWEDVKLWEATQNNPQEDINVESVINQDNYWNIGSFLELAKEMQIVLKADYSYPIILDEEHKLIDGAHRLVHAYLDGKTSIKGVIIKNDQWPEPDYDEIKACQNRQKQNNECICSNKKFEYKYENDVFEFLKNKKENVRKLVNASKERKSRYVFDYDYMYVIDKQDCTITAWYMGVERNFERWKLTFSPKILKDIEKETEK